MPIDITITIPDQYINTILDAFTKLSGKNIGLNVNDENFNCSWIYKFAPKNEIETDRQFAIRVVKETVKALIRLYDYGEDCLRYRIAITAINIPSQDIPDGIING